MALDCNLTKTLAWIGVRDAWRAKIGRLPRGNEARLRRIVDFYGPDRVTRAIVSTASSGLRRTQERWAFFLAMFGEAP